MQNLARNIVNSIMADNKEGAQKMFEVAMAESIKLQIEDYKVVVGQHFFEAAEEVGGEFVPEKRNYTVDAIDPNKKSERFPEGEPVSYRVNAYSPQTARKNAVAAGHTNIKIKDHVGNEVITEDTGIGAVDASLTAQRRAEKAQEDLENARSAAQQKAPTIQDVVSVLGNTVSVADTSVVNN